MIDEQHRCCASEIMEETMICKSHNCQKEATYENKGFCQPCYDYIHSGAGKNSQLYYNAIRAFIEEEPKIDMSKQFEFLNLISVISGPFAAAGLLIIFGDLMPLMAAGTWPTNFWVMLWIFIGLLAAAIIETAAIARIILYCWKK